MAVAEKLTYLNATKTLLREAITRAGHYLTEADPFRSYPYALLRDEYSLKLDFMRDEYIAKNWMDGTVSRVGSPNIITFTRGSGGGRFNHLGVFEWVDNNVARIDHDPATVSTSTSSVAIGAGLKTFAVSRLYPVGQYVRATADASNWVSGRVVASTGTSVTLWIDRVVGTGTHASWTLIRVLGLLVEESRTRLNTVSTGSTLLSPIRATYVDDGTLYIDGMTPFRKLVENTDNNSHFGQLANVSLAANTTYTASYVVKAAGRSRLRLDAVSVGSWSPASPAVAYNLATGTITSTAGGASGTITPLGNGVFLVTFTATTGGSAFSSAIYPVLLNDAGITSYAGDGVSGIYISGYNITAGEFATSLIVGEGSQVTRAADQVTVGDLSDWYRADEGTLAVSWQTFATSGFPNIASLSGDFTVFVNSSNAQILLSGRGSAGWLSVAGAPLGGLKKYAVAYTSDGASASVNGSAPVSNVSAMTAAATSLVIGGAAPYRINGHIRAISYYPRRLSNTELQRLTS